MSNDMTNNMETSDLNSNMIIDMAKMNSALNDQQNASANDAFDGSAEPIIYMSDNRMPVIVELNDAIVYIIFVALLLALLSILPGVRRAKLASFIGILSMLSMGASIILALDGTNWMTGGVSLQEMPYSALTSETISGRLEVNIGLSSTNVTLSGKLMGTAPDTTPNSTNADARSPRVHYNERFHWDEPSRLAQEHEDALRKGLPHPILTVTEFLSQDSEGFNWMRQLRYAGRNTTLTLYVALVSWCITAVVMCLLPVYLPHMMQITGAIMMSSVWIYTMIIQSPKAFSIHVNAHRVEFAFGDTYMLTFMAGAMSMFAGIILFLTQINCKSHGNSQLTIMDSEQYVNDQKMMRSNLHERSSFRWLFFHSGGSNNTKDQAGIDHVSYLSPRHGSGDDMRAIKSNMGLSSAANHTSSVIIPIADIEEKFRRTRLEPKSFAAGPGRVESLGTF